METIKIILALLILITVMLLLIAGRKIEYKELTKKYEGQFQLLFMASASLLLVDALNISRLFPKAFQLIHEKIIRIYGSKDALNCTRLFLAQAISGMLLALIGFSLVSVAEEDPVLFYFGLMLAPLLVYAVYKDLDKKIKMREWGMLIELPEFVNKIILLVNAGETVPQAVLSSGKKIDHQFPVTKLKKKKKAEQNPLYKELQQVTHELELNRSFSDVMEDFSKRCALTEVSVFTTTVLLNYHKGGGDFTAALLELSRDLWEKRKSIAKIQGEEASSKIVFPMVAMFLIILIIIATPALSLFKN